MSQATGGYNTVLPNGCLLVTVPAVDKGLQGTAPVTILNPKLNLKRIARSSEPIDLEPGTYVVSVALPDGSRAVDAMEVMAGETTVFEIPWKPSRFGNLPDNGSISSRGAKGEQKAPPKGFALRFVSLSPFDWTTRVLDVWPSVEVEGLESSRDVSRTSLMVRISDDHMALRFAQVAATGLTPLTVALPLAPHSTAQSCSLAVSLSAGQLAAEVRLGGLPEAQLVSQFVAGGELAQAAALPEKAERLLYHKALHPLGAAVGGYALLRLGALERLHDWPINLTRRCDWLPDGPIIAGELALKQGRVEDGVFLLLQAVTRGLPVFTDGYSMLVARLRELSRGAPGRQLAPRLDTKVSDALRKIGSYASRVDFAALLLTIRGVDLSSPTGSQDPLKRIARIDGWRLFRPPLGVANDSRDFWLDPKE